MTVQKSGQDHWPFHGAYSGPLDLSGTIELPGRVNSIDTGVVTSNLFLLDWDASFLQHSNETMLLSSSAPGTYISMLDGNVETYADTLPDADEDTARQRSSSISLDNKSLDASVDNSPAFNIQVWSPSKPLDKAGFQHSVTEIGVRDGKLSNMMGKLELKQDRVERRRKQNRSSQRRYRERKDAKVQAAQDEVAEMKNTCTELQNQCNHLLQENMQLRAHCRNIESAYMAGVTTSLYMVSDSLKSCSISTSTILEKITGQAELERSKTRRVSATVRAMPDGGDNAIGSQYDYVWRGVV